MKGGAVVFIRTVTGDINPKNLGFTHCHEHLFTYRIEGVELPAHLLIDSCSSSRKEARAFRKIGGSGVVDAQPFGAGRNARFLRRLSRDAKLHVIGATGFHKPSFYPKGFWVNDADIDEIAELLISEINQGMYEYDPVDPFKARSDIKAGIIKIATGEKGFTPLSEKIFRAAVKAHRVTGAPIMTHTELSQFGLEQAQFLMEAGVGPEHIIISHMDRVIDIEKNAGLAERGVFLEYDTIARFKYHSNEDEVRLILEMVKRGFGRRILLGMDTTRERMQAYGGEVGLTYIKSTFLPMLSGAGIGGEHADNFMVHNPRAALSFARPVEVKENG
jgi:phosphotriesterase-related protein